MYLRSFQGRFFNSELSNFRFFKVGPKSSRKYPQTVPEDPPKPTRSRPNIFEIFEFTTTTTSTTTTTYYYCWGNKLSNFSTNFSTFIISRSTCIFDLGTLVNRSGASWHIVCWDLCCERTHGGRFMKKLTFWCENHIFAFLIILQNQHDPSPPT